MIKLTEMEGDFMIKDKDDLCDIFGNKICDNCGKCLEIDGIDIRAINIEDIAKDVEENKYLEEELKLALESLKEEEKMEEVETSQYLDNEEYIDAFDNIAYLDELGLSDDLSLEDLTEEIYPGVLKFKRK